MDHLVHVEQKEIVVDFELGRKCRTTVHLRSLMHTMPVAFKLQTTSPHKFCVRPPSGYIRPLSELTLEIILKPQRGFPSFFPLSPEKFVLKTALAHITSNDSDLPERVPNDWFASPQAQVFVDAKLKVVYIGSCLLRECVARDDESAVEEILRRNTWPSNPGKDGKTALHIATCRGSLKLVDMLLEFGAEINAMDTEGRTPLWEAVYMGHAEVVKELIRYGAEIDLNKPQKRGVVAPIHIAATLTSTEILEQLIISGANLEIEDHEGRTPVHFAVESGRLDNLKVLLNAGARKNARRQDGRIPLLIAAQNGLLEVVHTLLDADTSSHVDYEADKEVNTEDSEIAYTAVMEAIKTGEELLQAARQGDVKAVTTLLQHRSGNMAWIKDSAGWTPLHVAAFKGHLQVVTRLLLEDGGKTALQSGDAEGHTPLHCAAEGGNIKVVELLLAMGADPRAVSCRGATAADLAKAFGFTTIAKLIEHYACTTYGVHAHHNNDVTIRRASTSKELKPLHRRSISPSPNVDHRRLSASDVRFSTPTKLHDNSCRQHQSSMAYYSGRTSDNKKSSADATRQHHNRLQQSTPKNLLLLEMLPQSGREPEVKFEHDSKLPSIISMPSNTLKPTENETLFSEVGARIARQKHQINTQHTSPHSSFRKLEHSGEKQNVAQSRRSKPGIQEENDSIYTPLHNKDKGDINTNRPTPCQRTPRLTLATLLGKARGSRMGLNSMLEKVTQNKSTESILQVPANQIEHQHILMVGNQNLNAFSLRKKSRSMSTELYMSDSDAIPTDERRNVSTELHVANSGMGPKDKRNIIGISSKEEHRLSVMIPPQNVKLTPCSSMDKEQEKHRIKESTDLYNKVKYEMSDKSSPRLQLHHHTTEKTQKHFNLVASRNTICTEGLKHTNEIIENPPLAIAATEPNIRLVSDGTTDLGIHGQRIISSASRSNQGIGQNTMMEESADSLQDSLPELLPQSLQVEMNVFRDNEVSIKHSLGQLDFSTGDSSDDENIMTMDKFPVTPSAACESIIDSDVGEKQSALASACISSTTSSAKIKDPHEHSILRDFQVFRDLSKSPAGPQVEKALTTMASSLADETSPNLHIQNISDVQVVSAEHALKVSLERTMTNADGIFGTHQDIPSISKPDRVKETKSSFNGPNMPTYAPPLRIKQMKKSVSVPMVKNSNPNNDIDAEAPENLLVQEDKVRQSLKPRSLIFKEIFR